MSEAAPVAANGWDFIKALTAQEDKQLLAQVKDEVSSPPTNLAPQADMALITSTPFSSTCQSQHVVKCEDCSKPILEHALAAHAVNCQLIKLKQQVKPSSTTGPTASSSQTTGGDSQKRKLSPTASDSSTSPSKKPKQTSLVVVLGDNGDKANKKKLSSDPTKTGTKSSSTSKPSARGPVDVDRQCGVINDKNFPCSRSLTCKTHSMGAKRSVPHRSQPYDVLLAEWQKMNKPDGSGGGSGSSKKKVEGGVDSSGVGPDGKKKKKKDKDGLGGDGSSKKERREKAALAAGGSGGADGTPGSGGAVGGAGGSGAMSGTGGSGKVSAMLYVGEYEESDVDPTDFGGAENHWIDSEEEVEAVLKGVNKVGKGRPISSPFGGIGFSGASSWVGRNARLGRLRDVIGGSFLGSAAIGVFVPGGPTTNGVTA